MVWALYPESNQRTLEEMDLLFAADSPWVWDAERNLARLKAENPDHLHAAEAKHNSALGESGKVLGRIIGINTRGAQGLLHTSGCIPPRAFWTGLVLGRREEDELALQVRKHRRSARKMKNLY